MLLRLVLLLLGLPLLAHGAEGIYHAARSRQMITVACDRFMSRPPAALWLRVTGCDIDYTHPAFTISGNRVTELFFAMRMRNEGPAAPAALIVATRDPRALAIAQQGLGTGADVDEETFTVAMLRIVDLLRAAREVDGYARSGIVERALTRRALAGFSAPLAADAVILDLHAQPSVVGPGVEAGAGLLLLAAAAALRWRRRVGAKAAAPEGLPSVLERCLPPAMLLNLDSPEVGDIEHAPPLGPPDDVAARISSALGPLADEGGGKYSAGGADWRLGFDLGRDESVWTIAVDARGSQAALDALDRLARETGWRVFVPRLGSFR